MIRATMNKAESTIDHAYTALTGKPKPFWGILRLLAGLLILSSILSCASPVHVSSGKAVKNPLNMRERDYSRIDTLVREMKPPRSYQELASFLRKHASDDWEVARGAYVWIAENIRYDSAALFADSITIADAETVFRTRNSVCDGYARLFEAVCGEAGIEAPKVYGYAKGLTDLPPRLRNSVNHAWNAVRLSGEWRLVDVTWGSGYVSGQEGYERNFTSFWFGTEPELFAKWHFPQDPGWLLLDRKVTLPEFQAAKSPDISSIEILHDVGFSTDMIAEVIKRGYLPEMYRIASMKSLGFSAREIQQGILSGHLPQSWQYEDVRVRVVAAPTQGILSSAREYQFEIRTEKPVQIAAIINSRLSEMSRKGTSHLFSIHCRKGELKLSVRRNGSDFYPVLIYKTI
jgi:hypothetical protein